VGIIVVLVGLLVVAVSSASKAAQAASTRSMMGALSRALTQFKSDIGYFPPVLGFPTTGASQTGSVGYLRDLIIPPYFPPPQPPSVPPPLTVPQVAQVQQYYSMTSMVEYLIGPGGKNEDGYGAVGQWTASGVSPAVQNAAAKESPAAGIRSPLKDGVWGAYSNPKLNEANQDLASGAPGNFSRRNLPRPVELNLQANHFVELDGTTLNTFYTLRPVQKNNVSGRVLGPYLELKDGSLLGAIVGTDSVTGQPIVARAGDNNWNPTAPKVLLDYYGQPMRFYRKGYVNGDPKRIGGKKVGSGTGSDVGWDLSDIFVLRPQRFDPNTEIDGLADALGDTASSRSLQMADFALFSSGPDQRADFTVRRDATLFNEDNIVEVGN
jgi:type II secretory pathway pseudopilin PulG